MTTKTPAKDGKTEAKVATEENTNPDAPAETNTTKTPAKDGKTEAKAEYTVAKGAAVTTRTRGIRSDGQEITADDFSGGKETLQKFVDAKKIDHNK